MYNKLFTKILDSSIWLAPDPHRLVWITLIAAMDKDGFAQFACVENLAARARVSVAATEAAVLAFQEPDTRDTTQEYDGRRIERMPGGWLILNAEKYRAMVTQAVASEQSKLRMRAHRERLAAKQQPLRNVAVSLRSVTPSEQNRTEQNNAESEHTLAAAPPKRAKRRPTIAVDSPEFLDFKVIYPERAGDYEWSEASRSIHARLAEGHTWNQILDGTKRYAAYARATGSHGTQFVMQASRFVGPKLKFLDLWKLPGNKAETLIDANVENSQRWLDEGR